ncbi:MAG: hypothetical protein WA421_05330 [Nitrososphaeraceae archaeon]
MGDHKHYPLFAACNSSGKNPGNVWNVSTKAHYGNEHVDATMVNYHQQMEYQVFRRDADMLER